MAQRPIFLPCNEHPFVKEVYIEFVWHPGYATTQARKSILSLHQSAYNRGFNPILEISSKSPHKIGVKLSAFNLRLKKLHDRNLDISVECAYQGSKVFEQGGPYTDLYWTTSYEAKRDNRLKASGSFLKYNFMGEDFPHKPVTLFYDWLYLQALAQNPELSQEILRYKGFSDIAFNPKKSLNCQARSAALFASLTSEGVLQDALTSQESYFQIITNSQCSLSKAYYHNSDQLVYALSNDSTGLPQNLDPSLEATNISYQQPQSQMETVLQQDHTQFHRSLDIYSHYFVPNLESLLARGKTTAEIADMLCVSRGSKDLKQWLQKAQSEGLISKVGSRYVVCQETSYTQQKLINC